MDDLDERVKVDDFFLVSFEEKAVKVEQECPLDAANGSREHEKVIQRKCLEIDKTKAKLREISKEKNDLTTKCESLISQVQDLEEDKALMIKQGRIQANLKLIQNKLEKSESNVKKLTQESHKFYEEKVKEHDQVVKGLQHKHKELQESFNTNLARKKAEMDKLKESNLLHEKRAEEDTKVVKRYQLKNESLQRKLEALQESLEFQERVHQELKTESQSKIESLQNQLEKSNKTTESVTQEKDKLKNEYMKHIEKVKELDKEKVRLVVLKIQSQSKIEGLQNQLEVGRNIIKTQTQDYFDSQVIIENLQKQLKITSKKAESMNEVTRNYSALIHELTQEKDKLKRSNDQKAAELIEERLRLEALKTECLTLRQKVKELQCQKEEKNTVKDLNQKYEEMIKEHKKVVKSLQESFNTNLDKLKTKAEESDRLHQIQIESLQFKLEESLNATERAKEVAEIRLNMNNIVQERVQLGKVKIESQIEIERLQNQLDKSTKNTVKEFFDLEDFTEEWKIEDFDEQRDKEDFIEKLKTEGNQSLKRKMDNNVSEVPNPKNKRLTKCAAKKPHKRQAISWP